MGWIRLRIVAQAAFKRHNILPLIGKTQKQAFAPTSQAFDKICGGVCDFCSAIANSLTRQIMFDGSPG